MAPYRSTGPPRNGLINGCRRNDVGITRYADYWAVFWCPDIPHRRVFVSRPGKKFNDLIFLASNRPVHIDSMHEPTPKGQKTLTWMLEREQEFDCNNGVLNSDAFNPLENL